MENWINTKVSLLDIKLEHYINNKLFYISLFGFLEGCFDAKEIIFYFIYTEKLGLSLEKYSTIKFIVFFPLLF